MAASKRSVLSKRWSRSLVQAVEGLLASPAIDSDALTALVGRTPADAGGHCMIDLRALPMTRTVLRADLRGVNLSHTKWGPLAGLTRTTATDCRCRAMAIGGVFGVRFTRCDFTGTKFKDCQGMPDTSFEGCDFDWCGFSGGNLFRCAFRDCRFRSARVSGTEFIECDFERCEFTEATFECGSFGRSTFRDLANPCRTRTGARTDATRHSRLAHGGLRRH